jgi:transposase InsO family protein
MHMAPGRPPALPTGQARCGAESGAIPQPRGAEAVELCGVPHEFMTDNGTPFVTIVRTMVSRFQRSLAEVAIRHIRTQIDTPWTNGKIEAFWHTLQAEVLDRQQFEDLGAADAAVTAYAGYYNYHRLHGELSWQTPAERFNDTPFLDRGFEHVPSLATELAIAA